MEEEEEEEEKEKEEEEEVVIVTLSHEVAVEFKQWSWLCVFVCHMDEKRSKCQVKELKLSFAATYNSQGTSRMPLDG